MKMLWFPSPVLALIAILSTAVVAIESVAQSPAPIDSTQDLQSKPGAGHGKRAGFLAGYLPKDALPNSLALIPAPPIEGSAAFAQDEAVSQTELTLRGTPRWDLATEDANLSFPDAAGVFSCSVGTAITEQATPHLYVLLRRSMADAGLSCYTSKDHYRRVRPFVINRQSTCTPHGESGLMKDGSYPSGHSAIGWAWALILTEIAPGREDAILARGRAFTESRVICNAHWQSDVDEGRFMGASTVARLHADAGFRADLEAAKTEYTAALVGGLKPMRDCAKEAAALAVGPAAKAVVH